MSDYFFRFESEAQALEILSPFTYTDEYGVHLSQAGIGWSTWEVGEISGWSGWHVNMRVADGDIDMAPYELFRVYPKNPVCVWA